MRKSSPILREKFNQWMKEYEKTAAFQYLKHKYFNANYYIHQSKSQFSSIHGKRISPYDAIIKKWAKEYDWDWRLITALIFQESKFNPNVESWAGAYGLMQFMPSVGPAFGVFPDSPVEIQIRGGIKKLAKDYKQWDTIKDNIQRIKFTLATYNAGIGHVYDAQRLTKKYGKNPFIWDDNVELYIQKLSEPEFYRDAVVYYGYMRGEETFNYVQSIFTRFQEYSHLYLP